MEFRKWELEKAKTNRSKGYYKSSGYVYGRAPYHPYANNKGYVKLPRLLMENHLGRFLQRNEHVKFIDSNKDNLNIDNLKLYSLDYDVEKVRKNNRWVEVKGYPRYEISDNGFLYDKDRNILIKGWLSHGYRIYDLYNSNGTVKERAHRLVAKHFLEKEVGKDVVNHKDGNKLNNDVRNLEWCTTEDNVKHAFKSGLHKLGDEHANTKLLSIEAEEIKDKYQSGNYTYEQLGKEYNIDPSYVGRIVREEYRFSKGLVD